MFTYNKKNDEENFPSSYSINLMWINRTLNPEKPYISLDESEEHFIENVLDKARKWKAANPEAQVVLWYDSQYVTGEAISNTENLLKKAVEKDTSFFFQLRDIREIDFVRQNPDALSDNLPLYYRIDLMKLILCVNSIEVDGMDAAIFTDLEVGDFRENHDRMNKQELFNAQIMEKLQAIGIQVNHYENQFIQILNKPATLNALKVYINACLSRAIFVLNYTYQSDINCNLIPNFGASVFCMMDTQLFKLIEMANSNKVAFVRADLFEENPIEEWVPYNMTVHGHLPLGNFYLYNRMTCAYIPPGLDVNLENGVSFKQLIKFENIHDYAIFSRDDMQTRSGNAHVESKRKNLALKLPADGSNTYQFHAWELDEKLDLPHTFRPLNKK